MSTDERGYGHREISLSLVADENAAGRWYIRMKRSNSTIGSVQWYGPSKRYMFSATDEMTKFYGDELAAISAFVERLEERKGQASRGA